MRAPRARSPVRRACLIECWIGLVFAFPSAPIDGSSDTCSVQKLSLPS
jgi:hypothetical protein